MGFNSKTLGLHINPQGLTSDEKELLQKLQLWPNQAGAKAEFFLSKQKDRWLLQQDSEESGLKEGKINLQIDFVSDKNYHRSIHKKEDLLWKAMGKPKDLTRVLDLSSGLALDDFHFLYLGVEVTAVERHPLLYFLLQQAHEHLIQAGKGEKNLAELAERIHFLYGDAIPFLQSQKDLNQKYDLIYFDPMYPEKKKKSAKPRQEMLLFRGLVGPDADSEEVFKAISKTQVDKFIIKRPLHAETFPLSNPAYLKPVVYEGKMVRYDVYNRK